jgi:energy-coupling factor transport system ATP-binding protein
MISLQNITLSNILTDINISIPDGGYIGIAGPNGSGKSTLARVIKGIEEHPEGEIFVDGRPRPRGEVTGEIGLVLTNPENQLVSSSIEEDVAFGLENMNLPPREIAGRTEDALRWASLWDIRDLPAHYLSAGQQQMLVIAGIMAMKPRYLIFDEATSMVSIEERTIVLDSVRRINREIGVGVIHISHDLGELTAAQRIYLMERGRVLWEGTPRELHEQEEILSGIGMELPPLLKLKSLMIKGGYRINENAMTVDEMAEEIVRVLLHRNPSPLAGEGLGEGEV